MSDEPKRWSHPHKNPQMLPRFEAPLDYDFHEIELRVAAQMKEAFGVPDKMLRHGMKPPGGTVPGRFSSHKPDFREAPPSRTKD